MDKKLITNLIKSMEIKKDDIVLLQLWGENEYLGILNDFCLEIAAQGATPVKEHHSRIFYTNLFNTIKDGNNIYPQQYFKIYEPITVVIDLLAYQASIPNFDFPKEKLNDYRQYMKNLMMALSTKEKFIQLRLPTEDMASESGLEYKTYKEMLVKAYSVDYNALKNKCTKIIGELKKKSKIEIRTGIDACLNLLINGRTWHIDAGNGDFPSGEVYIAPIENSANGNLYIENAFFEGDKYDNLLLSFQNGKLQFSNNLHLNEVLSHLPQNADVLCEFGIGMNDKISQLIGFTVFDEKAINTCHIGLGMNTMFGGENNCPFHTDIVFSGTVSVDGCAIISNGILK